MAAAEDVTNKKDSSGKVKPVLKCIVIKSDKELDQAATKAHGDDPFKDLYGMYGIIKAPYDLLTLSSMPENSSELSPSLDAMRINIEKLGYRVIPRTKQHTEELDAEIKKQIAEVTSFFDNAVLDQDIGTLDELRSRLRQDLETTGNAYIEVIPNIMNPNKPAGLNHLPSWTMRLRKQDKTFTNYEVPRSVRQADGSWTMKNFGTAKKFRRFIQVRENETEPVFFKEWGDPRNISSETGEEGGSRKNRAHEVIHIKLYCPRSPYGLPRWIGHLFAIYGARAAEEINYITFENNQIPAMALMATNVTVTDGSIDRMREFIEERIQGNKNYATILMIEAEPIGEGMKDPASMKLDLKPLTEFQHDDAMFKEYITMNNDMIRRAFRLPPIFLGKADDYNRAVAEASRKLAEEQIFAPERKAMDDMFTNTIIIRLGYSSVMFKSNTPNVTDNYELTQLLATGEKGGGLTPRISRSIVEDVFNQELPEPVEEINPDIPFSLTMLREGMALEGENQEASRQMQKNLSNDKITLSSILELDGLSEEQRVSLMNLLATEL